MSKLIKDKIKKLHQQMTNQNEYIVEQFKLIKT